MFLVNNALRPQRTWRLKQMQKNKAPNPIQRIAQIIAHHLIRETVLEKKSETELKPSVSLDFSSKWSVTVEPKLTSEVV